MLGFEDLKNRLMKIVLSTVSLFVRGRAVETPRFTYVTLFSRRTGGPDPDDFGTIYRDEKYGKEYLVKDFYFKPRNESPRYSILSIEEIASRPSGETHLDDATFKKVVALKAADIDVQDDMIAFFKSDSEKNGTEFFDRRKPQNPTKGAALPPNSATPS
jgi:hypothetical protein